MCQISTNPFNYFFANEPTRLIIFWLIQIILTYQQKNQNIGQLLFFFPMLHRGVNRIPIVS